MSGVLLNIHRRVMRAPLNPLDKSTIVSIYPIDLDEDKPTISPSRYMIPKGTYEKPSILVVTGASWWRELDEEQPLLEIPVSSIQVADSVVKDYCNSIFMSDMGDRMPGLFYVPGEFTIASLKEKHKALLDDAQRKQNEWYKALVNAADILWARTQGNPLAVMDIMRIAAKALGMNDKPWMTNYIASVQLNNCPACGSLINTAYPVCNSCHTVINKELFDKLGLKQA